MRLKKGEKEKETRAVDVQRIQIVPIGFNVRHLVDACLDWHRPIDQLQLALIALKLAAVSGTC